MGAAASHSVSLTAVPARITLPIFHGVLPGMCPSWRTLTTGIGPQRQGPLHEAQEGPFLRHALKARTRHPFGGDGAKLPGHSFSGDFRRRCDGDLLPESPEFLVEGFQDRLAGPYSPALTQGEGENEKDEDRDENHRAEMPEDRFQVHGLDPSLAGSTFPDQEFLSFGDFLFIMSPREPKPRALFWR